MSNKASPSLLKEGEVGSNTEDEAIRLWHSD